MYNRFENIKSPYEKQLNRFFGFMIVDFVLFFTTIGYACSITDNNYTAVIVLLIAEGTVFFLYFAILLIRQNRKVAKHFNYYKNVVPQFEEVKVKMNVFYNGKIVNEKIIINHNSFIINEVTHPWEKCKISTALEDHIGMGEKQYYIYLQWPDYSAQNTLQIPCNMIKNVRNFYLLKAFSGIAIPDADAIEAWYSSQKRNKQIIQDESLENSMLFHSRFSLIFSIWFLAILGCFVLMNSASSLETVILCFIVMALAILLIPFYRNFPHGKVYITSEKAVNVTFISTRKIDLADAKIKVSSNQALIQ